MKPSNSNRSTKTARAIFWNGPSDWKTARSKPGGASGVFAPIPPVSPPPGTAGPAQKTALRQSKIPTEFRNRGFYDPFAGGLAHRVMTGQFNLAVGYFKGYFGPQDFKQSYAWAHVAEASGDPRLGPSATQLKRVLSSEFLKAADVEEANALGVQLRQLVRLP